eukprot:TRINITY_DN13987_c0_g1_i2.p1 TRINITY_DN13987_c0_g1~~TRINITY_DN13987_c0_g1_i2.p1  ORF type:complete len:600 (-),score=139.66 TRINITY_DN13987_c0_g1_i2:36-1835(-)
MADSTCDSLCQIFPIKRIGLAAYFLAFVYLLLSWMSFQRLSRVRLFSAHWTTHKMLHWFLFCFAVVRTVLFGLISAFSSVLQNVSADSDQKVAVVVILFIFPEFVFLSAYLLLFFNWLEMYIFCHQQFLFELKRFQLVWKTIFAIFNLVFAAVQIVFYVQLYTAEKNLKSLVLTVIYNMIMYFNLLLPAIFILVGMYFHFFVIAGFEYTSSLSNSRSRKMSKVFLYWTIFRVVRGVTLRLYSSDQDWSAANPFGVDLFSILTVASILTAEVIPFNLLMDWATISLLLLSDEREAYGPQLLINEQDVVGSPSGRADAEGDSQWEIDPSELQVSALGMASQDNELSTTVFGSFRDKQVTVTMFKTQADLSSSILEELSFEVGELNLCDHEHIAKFYGHCVVGSTVYIVYEHLRRGNLFNFIQQQSTPFSVDFIVRISQQICAAMCYLHETFRPSRIHGGLTSKAVMLNQDMGACIINIGLNRLKTYSEVMLVTRLDNAWTPPEQIAGKSLTTASDVYSFGIILWELCTQERPFPNADQNPGFFRKVVLKKHGRPPTDKIKNQELVQIMTECWSQHPENRPTFGEVIQMLESVKSPFNDIKV